MKNAQKSILATLIFTLALTTGILTGCGAASAPQAETTTLKIGAAQVPHAEILEHIKPALAAQGVNIEVTVPTDETQLNQMVQDGEFEVNYVQHKPYLDSVVKEKNFDLVSIAGIHVEPIGAYSDKYTKETLPDGATVAIPNEGTNEYRALKILEAAGYIELKPEIESATATKDDIAKYIKPLTVKEIEAGLIVRTHDEYDLYISNTNRIIEGGLDPSKYLFREEANSPYANIVVVKSANKDNPAVAKLVAALKTDDVKQFILEKYSGAVIPAF